jgi:leader peptidase (prepilin peptidase) / N-methyltransferase
MVFAALLGSRLSILRPDNDLLQRGSYIEPLFLCSYINYNNYMLIIVAFFVCVAGLAFGSFINALEYRIEIKESINGRSFCPHCKHQLAWYDLFPLLSFLLLRGKCRYCGKKVSFQYPIVELLTGFAFLGVSLSVIPGLSRNLFTRIPAVAGMTIMPTVSLLLLLFITFVAVLVGLHDYKTTYILSGWVYAGILSALIKLFLGYSGAFAWQPIINYVLPFVLSVFVPGLLFYSLYFFSKGRWMGEGEYELAILIGLTLGFPLVLPAYYFAFIVGSIVGLILVYVSKKKQMNSEIPFGPYLMAGLIFALIFGQQIVSLYAKLFLG